MDGPKDPEPGTGARSQEPDEPEEPETVRDDFGNEAEHLWWVPMEFTHEFEDEGKIRFTFKLKVAGSDEDDARDNAALVTLGQIVDDSDFEESDPMDVVAELDKCEYVCDPEWEELSDDADDIGLDVDHVKDVEECFD